MRPTSELVAYLHGYFAPEVWRPAADLIGNLSISEADAEARGLPLCNGLTDSQFRFGSPPGITAIDDNNVRVRFPRTGQHALESKVVTDNPLPNARLEAELDATLIANAGIPNPTFSISVDLSFGSDILLGALAPPVLVAKRIIEEVLEGVVADKLRDRLADQLGGLRTYRYDRTQDIVWADPNTPQPELVLAPNFGGSRDPVARGYCDIVLVADGYTAADINQFTDWTHRARDHFAGIGPSVLEAPWSQLRTGVRIWRMSLVAADPSDARQRAAVPVVTPDRRSVNFANLARVAEIGLTARAAFGRDPIIVFLTRISAVDRVNAGIAPNAGIRAAAQGSYVLLDVNPGSNLDDLTATLVHELGHTPLGHYLADEYPDVSSTGACRYPVGTKVYRGLEPGPRNVSSNPVVGWIKWQPWSGSLGALATSPPREGAYENDLSIFRLQDDCRMRCSQSGEFCPVCREELTLGILESGHARAGMQNGAGMVDVTVEYVRPWTEPEPRRLHLEGGDTERLDVFDGGQSPPTRVRLTVVGSSVPEQMAVTWTVRPEPGGDVINTLTSRTVEVDLLPGYTVDLAVRHDAAASGLLGPAQGVPETSVRLTFDLLRTPTVADLDPPTELTQSVPVGAVLAPVVDPATGAVSLPQSLALSARLGGLRGYSLATIVEFRLEGPGAFERRRQSLPGMRGAQRTWPFTDMLPVGHYVWSARTLWRTLQAAWVQAPRGETGVCFEIAPITFTDEPRPPANPFGLALDETFTFPPLPVGLRASSWHPNDHPINLQFEMVQQGTPFTGQNLLETGFLNRNPQELDTLAIEGHVAFPNGLVRPGGSGDFYVWRVRAVDDRGLESQWVEGSVFAIYLPAQRPQTLEELRNFLETIEPRALGGLGPRGPVGPMESMGPRLFIGEEWPVGEFATDLSGLKQFQRVDGRPRRPDRSVSARPPSDVSTPLRAAETAARAVD